MTKLGVFLLTVVCISLLAGACNKFPSVALTDSSIAGSTFKELKLEIPTIACTGCWPRIEASAKSVPGVIEVRLDRKSIQRVIIIYDPAQTSPSAIIMSIEKNGDRVIALPE